MKAHRKLLVLLWKNLLLKRKHFILTTLEILIPTLLFIIPIIIKNNLLMPNMDNTITTFNPVNFVPTDMFKRDKITAWQVEQKFCSYTSDRNRTLLYTAGDISSKPTIDNVLGHIETFLANFICYSSAKNPIDFEEVATEAEMTSRFEQIDPNSGYSDSPYLGGIILHSIGESLDYTIRLVLQEYETEAKTEYYYEINDFFNDISSCNSSVYYGDCIEEKYLTTTFLQQMIDMSFIRELSNDAQMFPTNFEEFNNIELTFGDVGFSYPETTKDMDAWNFFRDIMIPILINISFLFIVPLMLKRIVEEKKQGVKELMKLMGLSNWLQWTAWFISIFLSCLLSVTIIVLMLKIPEVFVHADGLVLFVTFCLYCISMIMLNFVLSTIFQNPNLAVTLGVVMHNVTYFSLNNIFDEETFLTADLSLKMLASLVPNLSILFSMKLIMKKERDAEGMTWSSVAHSVDAINELTLLHVWCMMLASTAIWTILLWYLDNVRPGNYGVAKKFYFPFQKSYWIGGRISRKKEHQPDQNGTDPALIEPEPNKQAGIEVNSLRKVFRSIGQNEVVAVENASFKAFRGEILALLGHNGAGKTTTMSILTGLYSPSGGDAFINGHSILTDLAKTRESLGLCPQHNMLFPSLSVYEHLIFFGMLKGLTMREARQEGNQYIELLNLKEKRNVASTALSGGMKRKLHLAMALIGESKVVILDEPTSGMDPQARRGMWDILESIKTNRTILLTTHFMEEADILGDRIVIMSSGKITCSGSPMFLKSRLGRGFSVTVTKQEESPTSEILSLIQSVIPGSRVKNENSMEVIFDLNIDSAEKLPQLAGTLESNRNDYGLLGFGITKSTMEDVFLNINHDMTANKSKDRSEQETDYNLDRLAPGVKLYGSEKFLRHLWAMLVKKSIQTLRSWQLYLSLGILTCFLVVLSHIILIKFATEEFQQPKAIDLGSFDPYMDDNVFLVETTVPDTWTQASNKYIQGKSTNWEETSNITRTVLDIGSKDVVEYARKYIEGLTVIKDREVELCYSYFNCTNKIVDMITAVYNPVPLHSRPLGLNVLSNSILKFKGKDNSRITTKSQPFVLKYQNYDVTTDLSQFESGMPFSMTYHSIITIAFSVFMGTFLITPLKERVTNAKQVQLMAGVNSFVFWLGNLVLDVAVYLVLTIVLFFILYGTDERLDFSINGAPGAFLLLLFLLAMGGLPICYILSFPFKSAPAAFTVLIIFALLTGVVGPIACFLLRLFATFGSEANLAGISDGIRFAMVWFGPYFSFGHGIISMIQIQEFNNQCRNIMKTEELISKCRDFVEGKIDNSTLAWNNFIPCCDTRWEVPADYAACQETGACLDIKSFFTWDLNLGLNIDLVIMVINIFIGWLILILIETKALPYGWTRLMEKLYTPLPYADPPFDDDVQNEADNVERERNQLKAIQLTKRFKKFTAVRNLTFGVKSAECFGLLGVNGAGKTTTFRMLTGDEVRTSGTASIGPFRVDKDRSEFLRSIGYCPQFDSIIEVLTGRQMLEMFGRIRGIASSGLRKEVETLAKFVGLTTYLDRKCGQYSGGNKRKLNVALALLGRPEVMLLDEPTTGVDPAARRKIWETINTIRKSGTSIILTSHSMEECEALCDRLAIMVSGSFRCIGGPQHIKNKFGQGYQIIIKLKQDHSATNDQSKAKIANYLNKSFPGLVVQDQHMDYIHFHVPSGPKATWYTLYSSMEQVAKNEPAVEDYSINETSLEQIFLSFARSGSTLQPSDNGNGIQPPQASNGSNWSEMQHISANGRPQEQSLAQKSSVNERAANGRSR